MRSLSTSCGDRFSRCRMVGARRASQGVSAFSLACASGSCCWRYSVMRGAPILVTCCLILSLNGLPAIADDRVENRANRLAAPSIDQPQSSAAAPQLAAPQSNATPTPRIFPRAGARLPVVTRPLVEPQVTNQTRQTLGFYGGYSARQTLNQLPRRSPIQAAAPQPMRRQVKPFQTMYREPTVSPYLNLYRDEDNNESAPSYFAFVRPQMEQIEANRMQQREIHQLRGQLQGMSSSVASPGYRASGMPATGTPARYMDTAQFYGDWRR